MILFFSGQFRYLKVIFILSTCSLLTSCFEILEEVDMNPDGSGKMSLTINLSQSKNKVSSIMLLDSINGHKIPKKKDIQKNLEDLSAKLKKIKGISKVTYHTDYTQFIATVSFNFDHVSILNKASKEIFTAYKIKVDDVPAYSYQTSKKIFKYEYNNASAKTAFNKLKKDDKEIFKNATYTSIYRFPYTVQQIKNTKSTLSKSKKSVMQKTSILHLINNTANISNQIQLVP